MAWNIVDLVHLARIVLVKVAAYSEHSNENLISVKYGELLNIFRNIILTRRPVFNSVSLLLIFLLNIKLKFGMLVESYFPL